MPVRGNVIAAVDTAGPWVCVACGDASGIREAHRREARSNHNEILPKVFSGMLDSLGDLPTRLAVNVGPGSFTGTRVGVSFVAGLGQALGLEVLPVSSFVVAARLADASASRVKVALPLVRGVWAVCDLTRVEGVWCETVWVELTQPELERARLEGPVVCPWGSEEEITSPPDWNPAAVLVTLASATLAAFEAPHRVSVRYMGKCQAERNFDARTAH